MNKDNSFNLFMSKNKFQKFSKICCNLKIFVEFNNKKKKQKYLDL